MQRQLATRSRARRQRRGFNLIEAAIVLGVVGLVLGGIWVAAAAVTRNNNFNSFIGTTTMTIEVIQNNFRSISSTIGGGALQRYLVAQGIYAAPAAGYGASHYDDKRLGANARVSWTWTPTPGLSYGLALNVTNMDRGLCRLLANRLKTFMTSTQQTIADISAGSCQTTGSINLIMDMVIPTN